ncbi:hypothetical protein Tco_1354982 [Tanacetum coccineum]
MYGKASRLEKHMSAKLAWLRENYSHHTRESIGCSSSQANCYLTEKELHQLRMDEESLRETLEEEAMNKRAQEEKIRQKQAEDDKFFLEFGVLRDIPKGVLVLSGLSRVWKSRTYDLVLRGANGNVMGIHDFLCLPEWTVAEVQEERHHVDLVVGTPSTKVLAKADSLKKRKALLFGVASSHVAKRTRSAMSQSSGSTTRPSLFNVGSDEESEDDEDSCVEIPLITLGKAIMTNVDVAPIGTVCRSRSGAALAASFKDVSGDAIHRDFFPFSVGPHYATYPEGGIAGNYVDQFPTPGEMVRIEALTDDQLNAKMSVLHCLMMSHGGEMLDRYMGLLKSHHDYVQSADLLKNREERCASFLGLEAQIFGFQKQVANLNGKLSISDAVFAKSKFKGKKWKKKIKFLTKNLGQLNVDVARLISALNQATIVEAEQDAEILRVQGELLSLAANTSFERGLRMHRTPEEFTAVLKKISQFVLGAHNRLIEAGSLVAQTEYYFLNKISDHVADPLSVPLQLEPENWLESTVVPVSSSLELPSKVDPSFYVVVPEQKEEWINAMVDVSDNEMTGDAGNGKPMEVFVQGISHAVDGSGRVSSGLSDVVIALSVG